MSGLTDDQGRVYHEFQKGASMFITGPGGCGKSYLVEQIKSSVQRQGKTIYTTALTGTAACLIGGQTLHGWAGIGLAADPTDVLVSNIRKKPTFAKRWKEVDVLIIDEISMMSAELFNKLNHIAQALRKNTNFYGGIQVVFCGDFAQLEPVMPGAEKVKFCFETVEWKKYLTARTYALTTVVRQSDPVFQKILHEIRMGIVTVSTRTILNQRLIKERAEADIHVEGTPHIIKATILYPLKRDVSGHNLQELNRLKALGAETRTFRTADCASGKSRAVQAAAGKTQQDILDKVIDREIELCVGAQVMLTKNLDVENGLVNGSRGVVAEFDLDGNPVVIYDTGHKIGMEPVDFEVEYGEEVLTRKQVPLILAWAITIHKSQGASLSEVITDLTQVFGNGQAYVTLSRVKTLEGLFLLGIDYSKIKCNPTVREYYTALNAPALAAAAASSSGVDLPLVETVT
jgi:ATP-dependent DNA helicase PIF1